MWAGRRAVQGAGLVPAPACPRATGAIRHGGEHPGRWSGNHARGVATVTHDDVLYRFRLRALALAGELGNMRAACRALGIHHSTFYRWQRMARRQGLEMP